MAFTAPLKMRERLLDHSVQKTDDEEERPNLPRCAKGISSNDRQTEGLLDLGTVPNPWLEIFQHKGEQ